MSKTSIRIGVTAALLALGTHAAWAKVSAQEADQLGKSLTCLGAEKAGNKDGSIPEFSGKWLGAPPHVSSKETGGVLADPYADEKPLYTVTADNLDKYADKLADGQKALFQRYPKTYKMLVYPSHRDFRVPDWRCAAAKENALKAELIDGDLGVNGMRGAPPFPIPKTGIELQWSMNQPPRAWTEVAYYDQAVVYPKGNIAWGRSYYRILAPSEDPNSSVKTMTGVMAYFNSKTMLPERNKGEIIVGDTAFNFKDGNNAFQYTPGTRRVRQLPEYGFDMPQGPGGFRTVDDDRLFNGSPERYDWTIVGKREMLIPYDDYRLDDPKIKYADLLKPGHPDTEAMRFELHRVWVLQGTLKSGFRHQYAKRVLYIDEDSWQAMVAENYDSRGQLWRVAIQHTKYDYAAQTLQARAAIYYDLISGAYLADRLTNEAEKQPLINAGGLKPEMFTGEFAREEGK